MDMFSFRRAPDDAGRPAWDVVVDDAIIGRVVRRTQLGRNLVRDYRYSGPGRHIGLWEGTVAYVVELSEQDRQWVQGEITRPKTIRHAAAEHLIDAYRAAGVPLPRRGDQQAA